jgi:hypothetical protein
MKNDKKDDTKYQKNVTIVYDDGIEERFQAIKIIEKGVIIGRIFKENGVEEFFECGYIPKRNIRTIKSSDVN